MQHALVEMSVKAKAEAGYRFYALYDKISREDILGHAREPWNEVQSSCQVAEPAACHRYGQGNTLADCQQFRIVCNSGAAGLRLAQTRGRLAAAPQDQDAG
jgi:hypothetical protein